jgi:hypothetical protein
MTAAARLLRAVSSIISPLSGGGEFSQSNSASSLSSFGQRRRRQTLWDGICDVLGERVELVLYALTDGDKYPSQADEPGGTHNV